MSDYISFIPFLSKVTCSVQTLVLFGMVEYSPTEDSNMLFYADVVFVCLSLFYLPFLF